MVFAVAPRLFYNRTCVLPAYRLEESVDIIVRGKHFDVPDHVADRARAKIGRLGRYLPALADGAAEVDLAHEKAKEPDKRYLIHVTVSGHGVHLEAQERAAKPEAAVDRAAQVLSGQARKHKQLLYGRNRARGAKEVAAAGPETSPPANDGIGRVKHFPIKPMLPAEARAELDALGHDFFLFFHAGLDQYAVLYRRRAGDYGLIIPELS